MKYRHLLAGDAVINGEKSVKIMLTHCPRAMWEEIGLGGSWFFSVKREDGYAYACVLGLEISLIADAPPNGETIMSAILASERIGTEA